MRGAFLVTFVTSVILLFSANSKAQVGLEDNTVKTLKEFYTRYMALVAKSTNTEKELTALKKKYCTQKLLNKIEKDELDYDPIINAQDANIENLKTLAVVKDASHENIYIVSYVDSYNGKKVSIRCKVVKENVSAKIDAIL